MFSTHMTIIPDLTSRVATDDLCIELDACVVDEDAFHGRQHRKMEL